MDWKKELNQLLQIEDETTRQEAVVAWWWALPETEKNNILDEIQSICAVLELVWHDIYEVMGEWVEETWKSIRLLWDNPEIQSYVALLNEQYGKSLLVLETQDSAAAISE